MSLKQPALIVALGALLALSACHGRDTQRSAAGEVLSGSVSDAMLPLDATTSQPPHLLAARGPDAAEGAASDAASAADSAASAAAPAASPTD
jgi:hypothetical protein